MHQASALVAASMLLSAIEFRAVSARRIECRAIELSAVPERSRSPMPMPSRLMVGSL